MRYGFAMNQSAEKTCMQIDQRDRVVATGCRRQRRGIGLSCHKKGFCNYRWRIESDAKVTRAIGGKGRLYIKAVYIIFVFIQVCCRILHLSRSMKTISAAGYLSSES